jgi:hypothetical protein
MAEIRRLSVGKLLDKLRRNTDVPKSKITRLDENIETIGQRIERMRAARSRLERDQRPGPKARD